MEKSKYFVNPDIRKAETLPAEAFTSKEFLDLEIEKIFMRSWLWAPCCTPKENEWAPFEILGRKFFLMCDESGTIRAFPNACTHKWRQLAEEKGTGSKIICRYHGRQFGLDGSFIAQARCVGLEDFPRQCDSLQSVPFRKVYDFAFVGIGQTQPHLDGVFSPVNNHLFDLPLDEMTLVAAYHASIDGNWKYHLDNYVDELHLKFVHGGKGGLASETDIDTYQTKLFSHSTVRLVYAKNNDDGFMLAGFPRPLFGVWWHIFPNLTVNIWKGGISINAYEPDLGNPHKTNLVVRHYAWNKKDFDATRSKWAKMRVDDEDLNVVAGVQKVIRHTPVPRGRFTPDGEAACHWFQQKIYEMIFEK